MKIGSRCNLRNIVENTNHTLKTLSNREILLGAQASAVSVNALGTHGSHLIYKTNRV